MGIFDKAKEVISSHPEQADEAITKLGDLVDDKTGHQYSEKIDQGEDLARDHVADAGSAPDRAGPA
jgi:hypothetical protein